MLEMVSVHSTAKTCHLLCFESMRTNSVGVSISEWTIIFCNVLERILKFLAYVFSIHRKNHHGLYPKFHILEVAIFFSEVDRVIRCSFEADVQEFSVFDCWPFQHKWGGIAGSTYLMEGIVSSESLKGLAGRKILHPLDMELQIPLMVLLQVDGLKFHEQCAYLFVSIIGFYKYFFMSPPSNCYLCLSKSLL